MSRFHLNPCFYPPGEFIFSRQGVNAFSRFF